MPRKFVNLSLNRFLSSGKPLPAAEAVPIFIDLLYELEEDHKKGQVHGGIFPDQIVLDTKSGPRLLRLTEARDIDELTPSYLCFVPPERLEGRPASPQTDLYSMGVALYALLTGYLPFEAKQKEDLLAEIRSSKIKDLPVFSGSHEIDWMIRRCLVEVPTRRFSSPAELVAQLKKWMIASGLTPKMSATRPAHRLKKLVRVAARKHLVLRKTLILIPLLTLVTIGIVAIYFFYPAEKPTDFAGWRTVSLPSERYLEKDPTMSPDGSQVAFISDRAANWELYVKGIKEMEPVRLSRSPGNESDPRWSPQGDLILYSYMEPGTPQSLYAVSPAGGVPQRLAINAIDGQWSLDGKQICYVTPGAAGPANLVVLDLLGKEPRTILKDIAGLRHPSFSAGGEKLVCEMDVGSDHSLVLVSVSSGKKKILTEGFWDVSPTWNWKTGYIYFTSKRGASQKIYRTDTSGHVEIVTRGPGHDYRPAPSLKGDQIVFHREQIRYDIFAIDPATGIPRNISPVPGYSFYPVALPYDEALFYFEVTEKGFALRRRQDVISAPTTILENVGETPLAAISSQGTLVLEYGNDLWEIGETPGQHKLLDKDQVLPLMTSPDGRFRFASLRKTDLVSYSVNDLKTQEEQFLFSLPILERITHAVWPQNDSILYIGGGRLFQYSLKEKSASMLLENCRDFAYKPGMGSVAVLQGRNMTSAKLALFDLKTKHQNVLLDFPKGEYGMHVDWCLQQKYICYDRLQSGSDLFLLQGSNTTAKP